nr:transposase [Pseudotabrizicola algicola]
MNRRESRAVAAWLAPFHKPEWVVYAKPPCGGPEAVLGYLSRYTHRVAISNNRLICADAATVAFCWKDYRIKRGDRLLSRGWPLARTSCPMAFVESVTTPCWPAPTARSTSRRTAPWSAPTSSYASRCGDRTRSADPARALPLLRRPHARDRDLPPRPVTAVTCPDEGLVGMMIRPFPRRSSCWHQPKGGPAEPACPARPPRQTSPTKSPPALPVSWPSVPGDGPAAATNGHGPKPRPIPATTLATLSP